MVIQEANGGQAGGKNLNPEAMGLVLTHDYRIRERP